MTTDFVTNLYKSILGREPDSAGLNFWAAQINLANMTQQQVVEAFVNSGEGKSAGSIIQLYQTWMNRLPDQAGFEYWAGQLAAGMSLAAIRSAFSGSAEFQTRVSSQSNQEFVESLYNSVLGRAPDSAGLSFWVAQLDGGASHANVAQTFYGSSEGQAALPKIAQVIQAYQGYGIDPTTAQIQQGIQTSLGNVVDNAATLAPGGGETFTLTTGVDTLEGTEGNDTFVGVAATTGGTFNAADTIDGKGGTDTFNLTVDTLAANSIPGATVTNVEILNVRNVSGNQQTIDGNNFQGHEQIWSDRSTSKLVVNNLATDAVVGMKGNGVVTNADLDFAYATATDDVTLSITGGTKGTAAIANTGNGAKNATINSTGDANSVGIVTLSGSASIEQITINAATDLTTTFINNTALLATGDKAKMTVTGDASKVVLGLLGTNLNQVDASGFAGGLTLTMNNAAAKITGGQGDDVITTGGALTTGSVDAGDGDDKLIVVNSAHLDSATLGGKYSNFEMLQVNNNVSVNLDHLAANNSIGSVIINQAGNGTGATNLSAAQAANVEVIGDGAGQVTLGVKGATQVGQQDTVKMTVTRDNADGQVNDLTIAGVETLEVTSNTGTGATKLTAFNFQATNSIVFDGASALEFTAAASAVNANTHIDGSGMSAALTVDAGAGTTNGLKITGGSGNNTLTGTNQADVLIGGAGTDTFNATQGADLMDGNGGTNTFAYSNANQTGVADDARDLILNFNMDNDKIDISGIADNNDGSGGINVRAAVTGGNMAADEIELVRGNFSSTSDPTASAFTVAADGSDVLVNFKSDGTAAVADMQIGLIGVGAQIGDFTLADHFVVA